jgi:hypothetical protein
VSHLYWHRGSTSENRKFGSEEETFLSEVYREGKLLAGNIKSRLIQNKLQFSRPTLFLYPDKDNLARISQFFELEVKAFFEDIAGKKIGEIHIPTAYRIGSNTTYWGPGWSESTVTLEPVTMFIKHYLRGYRKPRNASITFFITNNEYVSPWDMIEKHHTGVVKNKSTPRVALTFADGWSGKFLRHYCYKDSKMEGISGSFSTDRLTLELEKKNYKIRSLEEVMSICNTIRIFLWYISFGVRQRTAWTEWTALVGDELIEYCQANVSTPENEGDKNDPLIGRQLLQEFSQHCLDYLSKGSGLDLYLPLVYLVNALSPKTVEAQFLSSYMSFESFLNLYARARGLDRHFAEKRAWHAFREHMKNAIDNYSDIDSGLKNVMANKLGIFNDVSPKTVFAQFCSEMKVDVSDLWPVYGNKGISLSVLRNKLVHGEREADDFLDVANENLKWIVERCFLAVIGWSKPSDVDSGGLTRYTCYNLWRSCYNR